MAAKSNAIQRGEKNIVSLGTRNGIEMAILQHTEKTLRNIVVKPDSAGMIDGVQVEPLQIYPDDRGFFTEPARLGKGLATGMVPDATRKIQVSFTLTYPGTIKAIHYHSEQTDLWAPVSGMVQVFLYDLRRHSKTFGLINTLISAAFARGSFSSLPALGMATKRWASNQSSSYT